MIYSKAKLSDRWAVLVIHENFKTDARTNVRAPRSSSSGLAV